MSDRHYVICAICERWIARDEPKADRHVAAFDGSLKYIELAHRACAVALGDDPAGWDWD